VTFPPEATLYENYPLESKKKMCLAFLSIKTADSPAGSGALTSRTIRTPSDSPADKNEDFGKNRQHLSLTSLAQAQSQVDKLTVSLFAKDFRGELPP